MDISVARTMAGARRVRILEAMTGRSAYAQVHHHKGKVKRPRSADAARTRGRGSADGQVVGALLVLGGLAWIIHQTGLVVLTPQVVLSAALITLGIGMVFTARRAGGAGLVILGLVLTLSLAATSSTVDLAGLSNGFGDRVETPLSPDDLEPVYQLGVGDFILDMSAVKFGEGTRYVLVKVGAGSLRVVVPNDVEVRVHTDVGAGELNIFGAMSDGAGLKRNFTNHRIAEGSATLDLTTKVGLGDVVVTRAESIPATRAGN